MLLNRDYDGKDGLSYDLHFGIGSGTYHDYFFHGFFYCKLGRSCYEKKKDSKASGL